MGVGYLEGTRFYKRNGIYYILADHPSTSEVVLQSTSPFGPYTSKVLVDTITPPISGGYPHQGGIVDAGNDTWYYMAFIDNYPGGRVPVLAPITWGEDGFPTVQVSCIFIINNPSPHVTYSAAYQRCMGRVVPRS